MRKYICIILCISVAHVFAIIPVIDINKAKEMAEDAAIITNYTYGISNYMDKMVKASNAIEQIKQLQGLEQVSVSGTAICDLCTPIQTMQLKAYVDQVNKDLCSQFSFAIKNITGLAQSAYDIKDIINLLNINPKAAGLALQQAAIRAQVSSQNTLAQIQITLLQVSQKQLAEEKLEQQNTNAAYAGFKHAGL